MKLTLIMKLTVALLFALLLTTITAHAAGDAARGSELRVECIDCRKAE
jgi:multisubunit Na+/H+ antiporter MnhG subunit